MELKGYLGVYASTSAFGFELDFAKPQQVYLWFVWEQAHSYVLQRFDTNTSESHVTFFIDDDTFSQSLVAQPHVTVLPRESPRCEATYVNRIDDGHASDEAAPARVSHTEKELYDAVKLDTVLRGDFAVALIKYKQTGKSAVFDAFKNAHTRNAIIVAHKHTFAEFGSALRKLSLLEIALKMYQQALDLAPHDPHARCNLGRIYFELRQFKKAGDCASEALKQDPTLVYAKKLLEASIKRKGSV